MCSTSPNGGLPGPSSAMPPCALGSPRWPVRSPTRRLRPPSASPPWTPWTPFVPREGADFDGVGFLAMSSDATTADLRAQLEQERDELRHRLAELGFADGGTGLEYD